MRAPSRSSPSPRRSARGARACPPTLPSRSTGPARRDRARWLQRFWEHARKDVAERGLTRIYEEIERPLVPVLAEMERIGIRVDSGRLEAFAKELERNLDNLTREIYALAGEEFTIASPKQLSHILFEKLKQPILRRAKTGPSTDADRLTRLALGSALPGKILAPRTRARLKGP